MLHRNGYAWLAVGAVLTLTAGCEQSPINTNDPTPPTAVIKVKGVDGQFVAQTAIDVAPDETQINLICIIQDQDGVHDATLTFVGTSPACRTAQGDSTQGPYTLEGPPLPATQVLTGNEEGEALTQVPLAAAVNLPFVCTVPGGKGEPNGGTVVAECSGKNWATTPGTASTKLTMTLPVLPAIIK